MTTKYNIQHNAWKNEKLNIQKKKFNLNKIEHEHYSNKGDGLLHVSLALYNNHVYV